MKPFVATSLLSVTLVTCTFAAFAQQREAAAQGATPGTAQGPDSFEAQVAEYIRRFPYQQTYDYTVRFTGGDPKNFNRWVPGGEPALVRAGNDVLPRTNNDTYYKGASLMLRNGPVVLESSAPTKDRFNSFQLVDDRNANYRNIIFPAGRYTLYFGERPKEVEGEAIEVPSAFSIVIARVEVRDKNDPKDVAAAKAVYAGLKINGVPADEFPRLDFLSAYPADVVAEANRRMDEVFATVPFTQTIVGPGRAGTRRALCLPLGGTKGRLGGPDPSHIAYEALFLRSRTARDEGQQRVLCRDHRRATRRCLLVRDGLRLGPRPPSASNTATIATTSTDDGGQGRERRRDVYIEAGMRDFGTNCLEVPAGRFDVVARYYLAHREVVSGAWRFPKIGSWRNHLRRRRYAACLPDASWRSTYCRMPPWMK